ncbi:MAG TPA: phosphotransferase, partial [Chloroflexia bacterium]|nr:phosphotransferase [Chloroflexia bacterium]
MARDRAFSTLSARGQAYRLRALAYAALPAFAVEPVRVRLISNHLNGIFRVDAADGRAYALRISHPTWRTDADLETEIAWLVALAAETDVGAPVPLPTRDGARVTVASAPGVPEPRRCVLFTWLPGVDLIHRLTPTYLSQLGVLAALLHAHAARFQAPPCLPQRRMDRIYARGEPDVLFTATSAAFFTPGTGAIFAAVRERVDAAFARRYADPVGLHLIHNDLHQENVKVHQGRLYPLDFEDA